MTRPKVEMMMLMMRERQLKDGDSSGPQSCSLLLTAHLAAEQRGRRSEPRRMTYRLNQTLLKALESVCRSVGVCVPQLQAALRQILSGVVDF